VLIASCHQPETGSCTYLHTEVALHREKELFVYYRTIL